ncbi:ML5 [Symbiodinium microadriaticum]|nr:ML5 [Symbiodinium microadriaticum]CAE7918290.1 ML5 [Symbiodinium sp. KB8]
MTDPPPAAVYPSLRHKQVRQLQKTEMCKFHMLNRCGKGPNCSFAHDVAEIRDKPNLNRTSMCKTFLLTGNCDKPQCAFAHDERELRTTEGFFKTKLCRFANRGRCKHGFACRFAHSTQELLPEEKPAGPQSQDMPPVPFGMTLQQEPSVDARPDVHGAPGRGSRSQMRARIVDDGRQQAPSETNTSGSDSMSEQRTTRDEASDQSTRADTSASVPTPEGSGDSGPEETANASPGADSPQERPRQRRGGERPQARHCTTMMLTNVPPFLTQGALISLLEDLSTYMRGAFDFFYCPWDPYQDRNLGYAIVNFFMRSVAAEFEKQWANQPLLPGTHGSKRLRIMPATLQGRAANLRHFSGFSLAHHVDPRFRPLVRAGPKENLQPMALSEEIRDAENQNKQGAVAFECNLQPLGQGQGPQGPGQQDTAPAGTAGGVGGGAGLPHAHAWSSEVLAAVASRSTPAPALASQTLEQAALLADPTTSQALMMLLANTRNVPPVADGMSAGLGQLPLRPTMGPVTSANLAALRDPQVPMVSATASDLLASCNLIMPPGTGGTNPAVPAAATGTALRVPLFPPTLSGLGDSTQLQLQYLQQLEAFGAYPDTGRQCLATQCRHLQDCMSSLPGMF